MKFYLYSEVPIWGFFEVHWRSQGGVIGVVTTLWAVWSVVRSRVGERDFSLFPKYSDRLWGLLFDGWLDSVLWVMWLGCEVNCSPTYHAEVKNEWSYMCTPPICLNGLERATFFFTVVWIRHRGCEDWIVEATDLGSLVQNIKWGEISNCGILNGTLHNS
jgi:hypothetical protein